LCRPIYDWTDGDVWLAHKRFGWDYNRAYDVLNRMGVPRKRLRIAPPTMIAYGFSTLKIAAAAWPKWFDRVCARLPGVRTAAMFGLRAVQPYRKYKETWQECFHGSASTTPRRRGLQNGQKLSNDITSTSTPTIPRNRCRKSEAAQIVPVRWDRGRR
jgi:predicted phosphoadenosine phosphosulfate sulfurtransferase